MEILLKTEFVYSIFRVTTPLLFAALAVLISNKAGMVNIGIEGTMLFSALAAVIASAFSGNALVGLIFAILVAVVLSLLLGFVSIKLNTNLILAGIALNLLASGGTVFLLYIITGDKGTSTALASKMLPNINIPLIDQIPIIKDIISGHNILTYIGFAMVAFVSLFFRYTKLGLRIKAVGENTMAVETAGISVNRIKYIALAISGIFAGCAGAFMTMGYVSLFSGNMTAGRGFIAIAAEAMGGGMPFATMISSLIFGLAESLSNALQVLNIPVQFVQMMPYVVTVIVFTIYAAKRKSREL